MVKIEDCEVIVTCSQSSDSIEGNASAVDSVIDAEVEAWIRKELLDGNDWAWCDITVTLRHPELGEVSDSLCSCSYENEQAFKEDGYYRDMVGACLEQLSTRAKKIVERYGGKE